MKSQIYTRISYPSGDGVLSHLETYTAKNVAGHFDR